MMSPMEQRAKETSMFWRENEFRFCGGAGSSRKFSVRLSPKGEWEFFEDDKHVLTPLEALSKTKIWLLEDVVDEAK